MSELPKGWAEATLAEVTAPRGEKADPSSLGDMRFLGMDHIEAHTANLLGSQPVSELKSAVAVFKSGDLLYGRLRPYLNKVHLAESDGAASAEFIVFPPSEAIEQRFLQSLLRSPEYRTLADQRSTGDRPRVKFENVSDYSFPLPPLPEQRRIVRKLDTLSARTTAARDHLSAIAKLVERYKHGVLGQIFDNLDRPTDELRSLTSLVTSGSRGWAKYHADDGPLFIRVGDTRRGTPILNLSDAQHVRPPADGEGKRTKLRAGDLVVSITADLGRVGVVPEGVEEAYVNQHIALVRPNDAGSSQFIAWYLISPAGQTQLFENDRGATKAGLGLEDIRNVQIPRCTSNEQREIVRRIETAFAKIDLLAAEAEKALKLTNRIDQRILAKAFAGELVPQDPTDEPASVLLERIRAEQASAPKPRRGRKKKADA